MAGDNASKLDPGCLFYVSICITKILCTCVVLFFKVYCTTYVFLAHRKIVRQKTVFSTWDSIQPDAAPVDLDEEYPYVKFGCKIIYVELL